MKNVIGWKVKTQEYGSGHNFTAPADGDLLGAFLEGLAIMHTPKEQYNGELYDISFEVEPIYSEEDGEIDFNELEELVEELPVEDVKEGE